MQPAFLFKRKDGRRIMKKHLNRIISFAMCFVMLLGLSACKKGDDWVFHLNGETVSVKDVAAFACIYTTEYNVTGQEQLNEIYEGSITYREYYKQQLEDDIISTVLLYKEAKEKGVKLSNENKDKIQSSADYVTERFGDAALEEIGVSKTDIENVYEMKLLGEAYLDTLSENESENDSTEVERYIKVYQVTFPTVALDENGMVQSDAEGNLKKKSSAEVAGMEQAAVAFAEAAKQGEDMEVLLKECPSQVSGIEKHLKYNDLESNYQDEVDRMTTGDVSDIIESEYGFYVIRLLEKDDTAHAQTMLSHEEESEKITAKEQELNRLYSEYAQSNNEYKNKAAWDLVNMKDYMKNE